jgi:hypothetical protein
MTVKSRSRARHILPIVTVVLTVGALVFACADTKRILGEECIKSEDCQSGICTAQQCTAAPPLLDRDASPAVDSSTGEAGGDAAKDAPANDAPAEAASDGASD